MPSREHLDHMAQAFIEQNDQDEAAGLAVLPAPLRAIVAATPDLYRGALLRAIHDYAKRPEQVPFQAGIQFGEVLGLLQAGRCLQVLTQEQYSALGDFLTEVEP